MKKNRQKIKIKAWVPGIDATNGIEFRAGGIHFDDIYIQITQDNNVCSFSIENYTISLTDLGYKLVKDV